MPDKQKRTPNRSAGARALHATVSAIGLATIGSALGLLFTNPSTLAFVGVAVLILNVAVLVFVATRRLNEIEYEEKQADSKQQIEDTKEAVKQGMLEALQEILRGDELSKQAKETIQNVMREEAARSKLVAQNSETPLLEDIDENEDPSQQKS